MDQRLSWRQRNNQGDTAHRQCQRPEFLQGKNKQQPLSDVLIWKIVKHYWKMLKKKQKKKKHCNFRFFMPSIFNPSQHFPQCEHDLHHFARQARQEVIPRTMTRLTWEHPMRTTDDGYVSLSMTHYTTLHDYRFRFFWLTTTLEYCRYDCNDMCRCHSFIYLLVYLSDRQKSCQNCGAD